MTRLRLRYIQAWVDSEGRPHHYFRRPGYKRLPLPGLVGSDAFMEAYRAALAQSAEPIGAKRIKAGTVAAAVAAYLMSPSFTSSDRFAAGTQGARRAILQRFRDRYGDMPIGLMPPKFIDALLGKMKPHAARNWFKAIRALCQFCVEQRLIKADPTQGMKLPKVKKSEGHHTWNENEIEQFEATHPIGSKARLALALGIFTLQRRGDVIEMGRQHIGRGDVIRVGPHVIDKWLRSMTQNKTRARYDLPIFPQLTEILDATPSGHLTFLVTKRDRPYSGNDFSEQFRVWCDDAGLPKRCTFHGLRKFGCVLFAERGCGAPEIASWSGHMTLKEVERYIRAANQKRLARSAMVKVLTAQVEADEENKNGLETVKPQSL
jgi:integrase